jgi:SulP family sulfate permease
LSPLIEQIPLAALVGVMLVVAQQTFDWRSLGVLGKVPRNDALVIVAVTVITVMTDLAIAVLCGVVIAALNFAWHHAREIRAEVNDSDDGARTYVLHGTLFFASTAHFQELFQPQADAEEVIIDCKHLHVADHSAVVAFETLKDRYQKAGRRLRFAHLSTRNQHILERAGVTLINV